MWVLAALSVAAFAVLVYVWFSQRRNSLMPHALVLDVCAAFRKGDAVAARGLAERTPCAFSDLVLARDVAAEGARIAARINASVEWLADIAAIADWIAGAPRYFLQNFKESDHMIGSGLHAHDEQTLARLRDIAAKKIPTVALRGV